MNRSHTPSSSTLPQTSPREISDYYDDTLLDYDMWSPEGYLHFGYWRPYLNPFVRRPMLEEMNRFIFQHLGLADWHEGAVADLGCGVGAVLALAVSSIRSSISRCHVDLTWPNRLGNAVPFGTTSNLPLW